MVSTLMVVALVGSVFAATPQAVAPVCSSFTPSPLSPPGIDATCKGVTETHPTFWALKAEVSWTNLSGVTPNTDLPRFH